MMLLESLAQASFTMLRQVNRKHDVVAVQVTEGPMPFARHAIRFAAWGTSVRLEGDAHRYAEPQVVLPLDDAIVEFEAQSLRS